MTTRISGPHADARLAATLAQLDDGSGNAKMQLWTSPRIAGLGDTPGGTMLAEHYFDDPAGVISSHVLNLNLNDAVAAANGEATWALFINPTGAQVMDCDVGNLASTAEVKLSNTTLTAGGLVDIVSAAIS